MPFGEVVPNAPRSGIPAVVSARSLRARRGAPGPALATSLLALLALCFVVAPAGATTKVAMTGDTAPGGNGTFTGFASHPVLTEVGTVIFFGETDATPAPGVSTAGCIFQYDIDGANGVALTCNGDSPPISGLDFIVEIDDSSIAANGAGELAFAVRYRHTDGLDRDTTFHRSAGGLLSDLGMRGGRPQLNDAGQILLSGGNLDLATVGGPATLILNSGDALPDDPSQISHWLQGALLPSGDVFVVIGASPIGIVPPFTFVGYLWSSGVWTRIATDEYGPFQADFFGRVAPHVTPSGRILAFVRDKGFVLEGVAEWRGGEWTTVVLPLAGILPFTEEFVHYEPRDFVTAGQSRFGGLSVAPELEAWVMVLDVAPRVRRVFLRAGDALPGGVAAQLFPPSLSSTHWAMRVTLDSPMGPRGIYVGRERTVPSVLPPAGALLAGVILALGIRQRRAIGSQEPAYEKVWKWVYANS